MAKKKQGRRIILIAETISIDRDDIVGASEDMTHLQGMIVFDDYADKVKERVDFIQSLGHQKYTSSRDRIVQCADMSLTEKVAAMAESFSLVFAICPDKEVDLLYQDLVHITPDVVTLH